MKDLLFLSTVISIIYFLVRAGELKLVKKQELDIKNLAMDSLYVFISSGFSQLVMTQMGEIENIPSFLTGGGEGGDTTVPGVFTNPPEF